MIFRSRYLFRLCVSFLCLFLTLQTLTMMLSSLMLEEQPVEVANRDAVLRLSSNQEVDTACNGDQESLWLDLESRYPDIPVRYLRHLRDRGPVVREEQDRSRCYVVPRPWQLRVVNRHWQAKALWEDIVLFVRSAYFDGREGKTSVRVTLMQAGRLKATNDNSKIRDRTAQCLFWLNDWTVVRAPISSYLPAVKPKDNDTDVAIVMACEVPTGDLPVAVSVISLSDKRPENDDDDDMNNNSDDDCDPVSNIVYIRQKPHSNQLGMRSVGVCTRGVMLPDRRFAPRLVEWVEFLKLLGATKIFVYVYYVHAEINRILRHYEAEDAVEVIPWSMPATHPSDSSMNRLAWLADPGEMMRNDRVMFTDCLYRNVHRHDYVANLDLDEIILPTRHLTWQDMLTNLDTRQNAQRHYFQFPNFYFFSSEQEREGTSQWPEYLHMARQELRSGNSTDKLHKSITKTATALTMYSHGPTTCINSYCLEKEAEPEADGILAHFRKTCQSGVMGNCSFFDPALAVRDDSLRRFADTLALRVRNKLSRIGMLHLHY